MNTSLLTVLNDISYIVECAALDYLGEGKREINLLCENLESDDPEYEISGRNLVAAELRAVLELYRAGEKISGTSRLNSLNRKLWKRCIDNVQHQRQLRSIPKPWHDGLGTRLFFVVGYLTFLPAFVTIALRAIFEESFNMFLHDLGILTLVNIGVASVIALAAHADHKQANREST